MAKKISKKKYHKKTIRKLNGKKRNTRKKKKTRVTSRRRYLKNHNFELYKKKYKKGGGDNVCPICLNEITTDNITTKNCNHKFHKECLKRWCITKFSVNEIPCPLCRRNIKDTCEEIIESDDKGIFNYTNIAGASDERRRKYIDMVNKFINKDSFDVNVKHPTNGKSILYHLMKHRYAFIDSIEVLLNNPDINIDTDTITLVTSNHLHDHDLINLFKKNKQAKKMLKPFI